MNIPYGFRAEKQFYPSPVAQTIESKAPAVASGCSVDGCAKPHHGRGWCRIHYHRWLRHGDPNAAVKTPKGTVARWIAENIPSETDECVEWPFSTVKGYGRLGDGGGKLIAAHRAVCEMVHGPAPAKKMVAAHSCGNGHLGCVNSRHLRWATYSENNYTDRIAHGTHTCGERHPPAKLTEAQVREIRDLRGKLLQREIGALYGIGQSHVGAIQRMVKWRTR